MPDINPLTNNQIFLKKIAENIGSDYETGDVSYINPLTVDQIFLKEIAANTAGQSGDITELEGKVAANTSAIAAIVNVNGCCNILNPAKSRIVNPTGGITFTINSDGSITVNGTATSGCALMYGFDSNPKNVTITGVSDGVTLGVQLTDGSWVGAEDGDTFDEIRKVSLNVAAGVTVNNVTVYPMLYDARLNPTGYVPYSMTNRELTERFAVITGNTASDTNITMFSYPQGFTQNNTFIVTLAVYISSYWYQYNNTTTFYAVTANGSVNVVAEDAGVRGKPIKLLLMKV